MIDSQSRSGICGVKSLEIYLRIVARVGCGVRWANLRPAPTLDFLISGLVGVYVTVPKVPNMLNMLDWACLAPRPKPTRRAPWRTIATRLRQQLPQR